MFLLNSFIIPLNNPGFGVYSQVQWDWWWCLCCNKGISHGSQILTLINNFTKSFLKDFVIPHLGLFGIFWGIYLQSQAFSFCWFKDLNIITRLWFCFFPPDIVLLLHLQKLYLLNINNAKTFFKQEWSYSNTMQVVSLSFLLVQFDKCNVEYRI